MGGRRDRLPGRVVKRLAGLVLLALLAAPLAAKDSLGVFSNWGAFRDPQFGRCYAIAKPEPSRRARDYQPYASVGTWPKRGVRGQLHFRLSRKMATGSAVRLRIGGRRFELIGGGGDAWARDKAMDAAIVAAMRSAETMTVSAGDTRGRAFADRYDLSGAATAMDAASVGCARIDR